MAQSAVPESAAREGERMASLMQTSGQTAIAIGRSCSK